MLQSYEKKFLELASKKEYWKENPADFMKEMLNLDLPIHQKQMLKYIVKYNRVSIVSSNSIGKSMLLSAIAVWFFFCYIEPNPINNTIVVFTAPNFAQVKRNVYDKVKHHITVADNKLASMFTLEETELIKQRYGANALTMFGKISEDKNRAEVKFDNLSYIAGVSSDGENKVVGQHGVNVLMIYDEAQGILESVYSDFRGIAKGGKIVKEIMIGNSTIPESKGNFGRFYNSFQEGTNFKNIKISCFDTHTFKELGITLEDYICKEDDENYWRNKLDRHASKFHKKKISYYDFKKTDDLAKWEELAKESIAPWSYFLINPISVYDELVECGHNINSYEFLTRCRAEFPLGVSHSLIPLNWIQTSIQNYDNETCWVQGDIVMGVDVGGGSGADDSAICVRNGNKVIYCKKFNLEIFELIDKITEVYTEFNVDRIQIESDGIGKDKYILLQKANLPVVGIQSGGGAGLQDNTFLFDKKANDDIKRKFNRKRDELWFNFRQALNPIRLQIDGKLPILLPDDDDLKKELPAITFDDTGKFKIIPKDDLRKILKGSPNKADSVIFAFAECGEAFSTKYKFSAFNISSGINRNDI